jgi:hypothetical protein
MVASLVVVLIVIREPFVSGSGGGVKIGSAAWRRV